MTDGFNEKQAKILSFITQSKCIMESIHRAHVSDKFSLLYPKSGALSEGKHGRGHSGVRTTKSGDLRILALPDELAFHESDMEESSLSRLMGMKIGDCISYLERLRGRVIDKKSKVLITGDVNSGKSTFVNALLRRELLPTDQQPCTQCFCEVVPIYSRDSLFSVESFAHAIVDYSNYDPTNSNTFDTLKISEMQEAIQDEETRYQIFKVYLNCTNDQEESCFLHSSAIDVSLIDSPGLNSDLFKTMSLFSKQEDIDVIVFLVNAANHLTLSACEFLEMASREKAHIFIVVNRFDDIKNREKCKRVILGQIQDVLPKTFEEQNELIHFISAGKFLKDIVSRGHIDADLNPVSASSIKTNELGFGDISKLEHGNFLNLENCLQEFILEKRTKSKLLPAQTYLGHLLGEILGILDYNRRRRKDELSKVKHELEIISPCFDELNAHNGLIQADLLRTTEECSKSVFEQSRKSLEDFNTSKYIQSVSWNGILGLSQYQKNVHNLVIEEAHRWMKLVRSEAIHYTLNNGLHLLFATASTHGKQIFSSFPIIDEPQIANSFPPETELIPSVPLMRFWDIFDFQTVFKSSTWLSAATMAGAIFGYQPLMSLALRSFEFPRGVGKFLFLGFVFGCGGAAVWAIFTDLESIYKSRLISHYNSIFCSSYWTHDPARILENKAKFIMTNQQNSLVARFEAALHQQRQLRAEKELLRCQTETLVSYLDEQYQSTHSLLVAIRSYSI